MLWLPALAARWGGVARAPCSPVGASRAAHGTDAARRHRASVERTALAVGARVARSRGGDDARPRALLQPGFWLSFRGRGLLMSSAGRTSATRLLQARTRRARGMAERAWTHARRPAHAARRDRRAGAADAGLLQAGSRWRGLPPTWRDPLVTLRRHAAGPARTCCWSSLWQAAAWVAERSWGYLAWLASSPVAVWSVPQRRSGPVGGAARRAAAGATAAVAASPAGRAAAVPLLLPPTPVPAGR